MEEFIKKLAIEIEETIATEIEEPAGSGCGYGIREEGKEELEFLLRTSIEEYIMTRVSQAGLDICDRLRLGVWNKSSLIDGKSSPITRDLSDLKFTTEEAISGIKAMGQALSKSNLI